MAQAIKLKLSSLTNHSVSTKYTTDNEILALLKEDMYDGWDYLYDKYAPVMYGTIMRAVRFDKEVADALMIQCFVQLQNIAWPEALQPSSLGLYLVRHCNMVVLASQHGNTQNVSTDNMQAHPVLRAALENKEAFSLLCASMDITRVAALVSLRSELKGASDHQPV